MNKLEINEHEFQSWDGTRIFYRSWHPGTLQKRAVVLFHGGHEHSGRWTEILEDLDLSGVSFFGWDARGHGRSPGKRGYAPSFNTLVRDADAFIRNLGAEFGIPPSDVAIIGHSEGAVVASSMMLHHRPEIRGMVLGSPALRIKLYVPFGYRLLRAWARIRPRGFLNSFAMTSMLTHDPVERALRNEDPLIARPIGVRVLADLMNEGAEVVRQAPSITVPTLILSAGSDWVVRLSTQRRFFERLGSDQKEHVVYPGFYHEVFHEKDRCQPISKARVFLMSLFGESAGEPESHAA